MSAHETLTVSLSPAAARAVREAIESGDFADPSSLIDAVVRSWRSDREALSDFTAGELDRLADEGEASGPPREADFDAIGREARRQFELSNTRK